MKDATRNLFFFFRGPSAGDARARHRQLENNLTKSLIVVLEHSAQEVYLRAFARHLELRPPSKGGRFSLQRRPVGAHTAPRRLVLGITGGAPTVAEGHSAKAAGRPDGWILTDRWAMLVESKLDSGITSDQLRRHAESAGWPSGTYEIKTVAWQEIYALFRDVLAKQRGQKHAVSRLLVGQWLDYLKDQKMVPFEKLEADDFDYFNLPKDDQRHVMSHVHDRIEKFHELVAQTEPAKRIVGMYGAEPTTSWKHSKRRVGEWGVWCNVGGEASAKSWHATVFFRSNGIDVEVLGSGRNLTSRFVNRGTAHARDLTRLCAEAAVDPPIEVGCRRAWYADPDSPYKGQHIAKSDEPLVGHPLTLDQASRDKFAEVLHALLGLKDKRYRTELIIRYGIPRAAILNQSRDQQVATVADALQRVERPLLFLFSP